MRFPTSKDRFLQTNSAQTWILLWMLRVIGNVKENQTSSINSSHETGHPLNAFMGHRAPIDLPLFSCPTLKWTCAAPLVLLSFVQVTCRSKEKRPCHSGHSSHRAKDSHNWQHWGLVIGWRVRVRGEIYMLSKTASSEYLILLLQAVEEQMDHEYTASGGGMRALNFVHFNQADWTTVISIFRWLYALIHKSLISSLMLICINEACKT